MTDTLLDPSGPPTAHRRAFRTSENTFQWFENPDNKNRRARFAIAMQGSAAEEPEETIFRDLPSVLEQLKEHWKEFLPQDLEAGMLTEISEHNFLEPQPVKNAAAFLVRHVMHDWSDVNIITILTHLRAAAVPTTKLVIIENIAETACAGESTHPYVNSIPILGVLRKPAPHGGVAPVNNLVGGGERTLEGFYDVLKQSGWQLVEVYHCLQTDSSYIIADPIVRQNDGKRQESTRPVVEGKRETLRATRSASTSFSSGSLWGISEKVSSQREYWIRRDHKSLASKLVRSAVVLRVWAKLEEAKAEPKHKAPGAETK
ncbi:hypothetical protein K438DRAFT_1936054 [Mycena galopus ATCC 62051]|nr:hypothetical protein K438DRAFT_1936054 [Mycena galopus ATCC 62051]